MADIKIAGRIKAGAADNIAGYASEILFDDEASNKTVKEKIEEAASSPQTMIVTISPDGNDGYEADKTFTEIKAFIDNGGTVIAKDEEDGDSYYYLDNYIASEVVFTRNIWGSGGFSTRYYTIDNTNTVSFIDSVHHISSDVNSSSTANLANSAAVKTVNDKVATKQDTISDLATIRSGAAAGATAVQPTAMNTALAAKEDKSNKVTSFSSPTDTQYPSAKLVNDQLATKQGTISDLSTIRSGASAGATAYHKPGTGIPPTDLASAVQTSLGKADTAIQSVTVGTTTTGAAGSSASVTNTGTATEPVLSFTIPQGAQGIQGIQGPQGERGPQGNTGVQVDSVASIIHSIDPTATYAAADVAGADAVQDVLSELTELAGVFDLSKHNAVGGVLAIYANLDAALNALNALDSKYKYGGMSFKFVQSSDNNSTQYVQYRYMGTSTAVADFTNVANWQGVDDEPTAGSDNLVKSGGVAEAIKGINQQSIETYDKEILVVNDNNEMIVGVDDSGLKSLNLFYKENDEYKNVKDEINSGKIPETSTQEIHEEIVFDNNGEEVAKINKDGVYAKEFILTGTNTYNEVNINLKKLELPIHFVKNKVVDKQKRCVVSFNGDSIIGSQLDDLEVCPEYDSGAFPPNMSKMIMARKFYDEFKFPNEDTQFRNVKHSDWVKSGFNKSQKYKPNATEPYTSNDLMTFNEIETYGCNSIDDYAQITVTGYKYFKLIWSQCSYAGYSFDVRVSVDGGAFITPSEANIDLPDNVSYNMYAQNATHLMIKYKVCELDPTKTYIIKVTPNNANTCQFITFWGCEYWNNPRLDVVVEAYSGSTAKDTANGKLDGFYSDWHKPIFVVMDLLCINDNSYVDVGSETIDEWMKSNAAVIKRCVDNGISILAYRPHPNNKLVKSVESFAKMFNLAFIDIRKKMEETNTSTSQITNNTDGLHLNDDGQTFYYNELRRLFI